MDDRSPLKWIGGKFYQRKKIISLIPPHTVWCEVFGGSGHITFAKSPSKVEIYNDICSDLVNFFLVARDRPKELIERLDTLPYSRELYMQYKASPLPEDPLERAAIWGYLLLSSFSAKMNSGWGYGKENSYPRSFRSAIQRINIVRDRFKKVLIENIDFRDCIQKYDSEETVFFIDPPYDGAKEDYYKLQSGVKKFTKQDHIDLANILNQIKGKAIITYYPTDLIQFLYPEPNWYWIHYIKKCWALKAIKENRKSLKEVIITNFFPGGDLFSNFPLE